MPMSASARPTSAGSRAGLDRPVNPWVAGARPRTLGAAVTPVFVGTGVAWSEVGSDVVWWRAGAALVVALALQVGVNFANDYSDGVRGTDDDRVGPARLTASGAVSPGAVRRAAALAFLVAASTGLALAVVVDLRLLLVGAASIAAGVLYTGGPRPYGYSGGGELAVLGFFGIVATTGTAYVQLERIPLVVWPAGLALGAAAAALLVVNNLRDIETDERSGKRTLAVRLGAPRTRNLYVGSMVAAFVLAGAIGVTRPPALVALAAAPLALRPVRAIVVHRGGPTDFLAALQGTARLGLVFGILLAAGIAAS